MKGGFVVMIDAFRTVKADIFERFDGWGKGIHVFSDVMPPFSGC